MNKTQKLLLALAGTVLAGSLSGCAPEQILYEQPSQAPQVEGYDDDKWVWDPVDGEWEYEDNDGLMYFYHGKLFKKSLKASGLKSTAPIISSSSKLGGFGSGARGGSFGG